MRALCSSAEPLMNERCCICQSQDTSVEEFIANRTNQLMAIVLCKNCGHAVRLEKRDFDTNIQIQIAEFDGKSKRPKHRPRWPQRLSRFKLRVERLVSRSGRILDIGCGPGMWLSAFGNGWQKYGVEPSSVAAQIARDFANADVFCGPIEQYEAEANFFDVISAFALIEHLRNPKVFLRWSHRHLKPGGILILMTGDRESRVAQKLGSKWPLYAPHEHVHFFSGRSLEHLIEETGFRVIRREWEPVRYFGDSLFLSYIARLKALLGMVKTPLYDHLYVWAQKPNQVETAPKV